MYITQACLSHLGAVAHSAPSWSITLFTCSNLCPVPPVSPPPRKRSHCPSELTSPFQGAHCPLSQPAYDPLRILPTVTVRSACCLLRWPGMDGQGLLVEPLSWSQLRQKDVYSQGGQLNRGKGEGAAEMQGRPENEWPWGVLPISHLCLSLWAGLTLCLSRPPSPKVHSLSPDARSASLSLSH